MPMPIGATLEIRFTSVPALAIVAITPTPGGWPLAFITSHTITQPQIFETSAHNPGSHDSRP